MMIARFALAAAAVCLVAGASAALADESPGAESPGVGSPGVATAIESEVVAAPEAADARKAVDAPATASDGDKPASDAKKPATMRKRAAKRKTAEAAKPGAKAKRAPSLERRMAGAWVLSDPEYDEPTGIDRRVKFFGGGRWCITESADDGTLIYHHGGSYTLDGDSYHEVIEYAGPSTAHMIGTEYDFTVSVKGGQFRQVSGGDGNPFTETWVRPDAE